MPKLILQPYGSGVCGQCCIAMAAGISLKKAILAVGHESYSGTTTQDIVKAMEGLGIRVAKRLKRVSKNKPILPKRAFLSFSRDKNLLEGRKEKGHWALMWDGEVLDPGGAWPDGYQNWKITSYLEILH